MRKPHYFSLIVSSCAVLVGVIVFAYNWNIVGGGWPYFGVFLYPGNILLSFFSEEINFWPKLALQMSGQFLVTYSFTYSFMVCFEWVKGRLQSWRQ